jgi:aminopeptidase Y
MTTKGFCLVAATAALSGVSALQIPLNLQVPKLSWGPFSDDLPPLVDTKELQKSIKPENLEARAKDLYEIAKNGEEEYGHPTRVIGSEGELLPTSAIVAID